VNPVNILLVAAVIVFVIFRQMTTQRVGGKALLIPGALMVYGLYEAYFGKHPTGLLDPHHVVISVALFAIGLVLAAGTGVWRGVTVHAWRDQAGALWRKGTVMTVVAWVVSIGSRVLVGLGGGYVFHTAETTASLMIAAGVSLIVQNLVISRRAHELPQSATATVMGGTGVRMG
jgi:hypothetical protein